MIRTVLRGKLTLNMWHKGSAFLMDTDIGMPYDHGIPPVVRKRTASLCEYFKRYALAVAYGMSYARIHRI